MWFPQQCPMHATSTEVEPPLPPSLSVAASVILEYLNTADRRAGPPLRRVVRVPHRPLPGQGDDAEPAHLAFLQHHVRAHLEPQLHPERDVHLQRGLWNGRTRGVLRQVSLSCFRLSAGGVTSPRTERMLELQYSVSWHRKSINSRA